jgi:uncharacterized RDD family membrane protein YckC
VTSPAGWYDDPQNPTQERYFDGAVWTAQARPRQSPPPYQGGYAGTYQTPQGGFGYQPQVPSTPDGVPLSGWWKRVLARMLDGLIVLVISLPLTGYFYYRFVGEMVDYQRGVFDQAMAGSNEFNSTLPWDVYKWTLPVTGIALVMTLAYEFFFLTRTGATPGKRVAGISVRLRDVPGPPPGVAVARRWGLYSLLSVLGGIPLVGSLFGLVALLNVLWPLWDDKKQALHDKVGATNVVQGPQQAR